MTKALGHVMLSAAKHLKQPLLRMVTIDTSLRSA